MTGIHELQLTVVRAKRGGYLLGCTDESGSIDDNTLFMASSIREVTTDFERRVEEWEQEGKRLERAQRDEDSNVIDMQEHSGWLRMPRFMTRNAQ